MQKTVRNATILGLGLSASALIGWLFLRESKRKQLPPVLTVRSQVGSAGDEMPPIVLPREALDADTDAHETAPPPDGADDFTQLRGIGPRFARALTAGGITTYAALARETPESLAERMAPYATVRAQRIRDFDWIGQAKARAQNT